MQEANVQSFFVLSRDDMANSLHVLSWYLASSSQYSCLVQPASQLSSANSQLNSVSNSFVGAIWADWISLPT